MICQHDGLKDQYAPLDSCKTTLHPCPIWMKSLHHLVLQFHVGWAQDFISPCTWVKLYIENIIGDFPNQSHAYLWMFMSIGGWGVEAPFSGGALPLIFCIHMCSEPIY